MSASYTLQTAYGARDWINTFDLKKRCMIGTTSMDAELSFITANVAQVRRVNYHMLVVMS